MWYGPQPTIVVHDPELTREVTPEINLFQKPHAGQFFTLLAPGLVSYNGDKWAENRKLINPAFHLEELEVNLIWFRFCTKTSCQRISKNTFGSDYEEGKRIIELQRELAEHCVQALASVFIPGLRFLPTKRNRRRRQIAKDVEDSIREIISFRMNSIRAGEACEDDLLGILLESSSQEIDNHESKDFGMSIEEVIDECKQFYFAGQETTSALLVWTMILLIRYPDWQARSRDCCRNFLVNCVFVQVLTN
ncbi:cytochrome P450 CYP72A219-like [Coffea eugenioides]|uniref:Cytochrome P450 CYP72A219-like n=1 Tax=Coffea arabica TaxID=13443 RepID=A0ABM4UF55_COFAR|nr:cytochrome P450 CYP72A219-like [Coffea eugenioides]